MNLYSKQIKTPIGKLTLVAHDKAVMALLWENEIEGRVRLPKTERSENHPLLTRAGLQLAEYFAGERTRFALPLDPIGTEFQKKVWSELRKIPYGESRSYSQLAQRLGSPRACRAVGAANGRNPISIIVPCHRVIGKDGTLTGFAGGLKAKSYLLKLEELRPS